MQRNTIFLALVFLGQTAWAQPNQIAVPRVEMMPDQPAPYDMRNWKTAALNFDAFVYDQTLTGQYLPLVGINPAGVNYPQNQSFRLHTYVGTDSPFGNEAINVMPSLVGASLVGIDKGDQFGKDWLLMSQDFFNKANGENLYLNNAGASSGQDWWYDMMPNVYFYQLYDLHPDLGGESDWQFTTIADRFSEAVRAMGGYEAPWQPAYMNYRAWKFKTMEPNANGVREPEAAGAFAYILYNAWKTTGNAEYLKAAEWSLEFLDGWTNNPSYELQLPYGTLTASRMNAELGTDYDVEKMVNWSFEKGELRNWGTIVGNWGGMDASGLVGEANDAGNDYAFQMNGMQQAAALVPMVRYDKRFARAIGKWVLNMANATRLFYSEYLPANLQDGEAWSNANDPQHAVGYEALREVYQGLSPFATGDAVNGGWAATNLALYGSSSIGYLGALVEKTGIDKILKINVLATDFYNGETYPTYLFYNSYATPKTVQFDAGSAPSDLYEALSGQFIQQGVSGNVYLTIPADQAILLTVCPTGGVVSFDKNKMLVNGVVVDFQQAAQPFTWSPRFKALAAADAPLEVGETTPIFATVGDADSDQFNYQWSSTGGSVSGTGAQVNFTAPAVPGMVQIQCIVNDPQGNADTASLEIEVVLEINEAPQIIDLQKDAPYAVPSGAVQLTCLASDPDLDPLTYQWSATGGSITGTGASVQWSAPTQEGIYEITVTATDDQGLSAQKETTILVKTFTPTAGDIIADYPFSGNANDVSGNNLHGQAFGAIPTADVFGNALSAYYFNGGNQHISVANSPLLNFQDGITVSCWFKPAALPEKETFLLSHGSWQNRWKLSITPDKRLRWTVNTLASIGDLDGLFALQMDSFYHIAATYGDGSMAIYLNGELHSYRNLSGAIRTTTTPFLMGQMLPGETGFNFKGTIDEVKIFDHALVPEEVAVLFEQDATTVGEAFFTEGKNLLLYPNPAGDWVQVVSPIPLEKLRVFDLTGRLVWEQSNEGALNISSWQSGVYMVIGQSKEGIFAQRFLK
ncbi:MAG: T9SS type A sorting domain-containing protein [Saprospiraceae bacterium]|nr:T9SS type A sorting domain-containing protein [Saprospiraceae bacterium]